MTLRSGLLEQLQCRHCVARAAAAVDHHLRERHLRLAQTRRGRARDPGARCFRIRRDAVPVGQHPAVHVLRLRHALGGAAQPVRRLLRIGLDTDALVEAEPEVERGDQIAGGGSLLEPMRNLCRVLGIPSAVEHEIGEVDLRSPVAGFARDPQPACRLVGVRRHSGAGQIQ